ncbi:hypothetical protein B566_EDAN012555 [Ephemera danica]|nr:hypothetical protein B566_EDAN012555 [Ephemera danica]
MTGSRPTSSVQVRRRCTNNRTYFKSDQKCTVFCFFDKEYDNCVEENLSETFPPPPLYSAIRFPNRQGQSVSVQVERPKSPFWGWNRFSWST